jgi:hypothetical protein
MALDSRNIHLPWISAPFTSVQPLVKDTFIKALESSPVHCLKPRPTGKRLRPANGGAREILCRIQVSHKNKVQNSNANQPSVNIVKYCLSSTFTMGYSKIIPDPGNQVIFENALDDLM